MADVPRIIHLMYFPWGKDQKLLADQDAFDHAPYERMRKYAPDFEVKLWDYRAAEAFCLEHYPDVWRDLKSAARPVMLVDSLRWLVVYHFGGVYWQYDMTPLAPIERMMPAAGMQARMFVEFILSEEQCRRMAEQPIRKGVPEEPIRVLTQTFSAVPRHPFVWKTFALIMERIRTLELKCDYDLLYISANAVASTGYDLYGRPDPAVELTSREDTRKLIKIHYKGRWRVEQAAPVAAAPAAPSARARAAALARGALSALPGAEAAYHRWVRPHIHETVLPRLSLPGPWTDAAWARVAGLLAERGIRSVLEFPCAEGVERRAGALGGIRYDGGDVSRARVAQNGGAVRFLNPMYQPAPPADLVICRDYLEHLNYREIGRALRSLAGKAQYVLLGTHPLMNENWETALGDWRPVSFTLPPFSFPAPLALIPDPDPRHRPDRALGLWRTSDLALA